MHIPASIKKVPKWAWYTTGGLVIAFGVTHLWNNRTTADAEAGTTDTTTDPSGYQTVPGGNGSVIVPPVITTGGGDPDATGVNPIDLQSLWLGGFSDLQAGWETLNTSLIGGFSGVIGLGQDNNAQLIDLLANGGDSSVEPTTTTPSPVAATTQPSHTAAAVKVSPGHAGAVGGTVGGALANHPPKAKTCREEFPNFPNHDSARGPVSASSCFDRNCVKKNGKKKMERTYKNGDNVRTDNPCG